jgi:glycosyltransferase involved in cell wall biosynthesis
MVKLKLALIGIFAKRIIAVSNSLKTHLAYQLNLGKGKLEMIYNGIDLVQKGTLSRSEARMKINVADDAILIGAIGNIKKAKGYDVLIRTAGIYACYGENCKFLIAGREDIETFESLITLRKKLNLESKVLFIGYQDKPQDFLTALDVLLLTSESEGFSLAIVEAMNSSIPVVATRCGGPQEIITHNIDGVLAEVGDAKGLAFGLQAVLAEHDFREMLIKRAARTVQERFSLGTMVSNYEDVYNSLICHKLRGE